MLVNANLKHSLNGMIYALFGNLGLGQGEKPLQVRWIDAYFPWTSPSYEVEVLFDGKWLEILGCGVMQQAALARSSLWTNLLSRDILADNIQAYRLTM